MATVTVARRVVVRSLPVVLLLAVVALLVVRFLAFGADGETDRPVASARTLADRTAELERRVAVAPDDPAAWQQLAIAYTSQASATGDPAFYDLAERAIERAEELAPGAAATLIARGNLELVLHRFADAHRTGTAAVSAAPATAEAYGVLVDAQVELGRYDAAAETLQRMLNLDPGLPALARTSYLRQLHGDVAGAVTAMQQAETAGAAGSHDVAVIATLLGDLHRQQGATDAAAAAYGRALDAVPGHVPAQLGQARLRAIDDGPAAALAEVEAIVDSAPRLDAVLLLAELQAATGAEPSAIDLARAITALQADAGQVVDLELALLEADLGDDARAVELATAAYEDRPENVFTAGALAWALHRAGRSTEARPMVDQALRLGTADPALQFRGAAVLAATGERERARELLDSVLTDDPWFSFALLDDARALADELGVTPPAAWERS